MNKVNVNKVVDYANILKENERLNNIIKEAREEMENYIRLCVDITPNDVLDLLDKVEEKQND